MIVAVAVAVSDFLFVVVVVLVAVVIVSSLLPNNIHLFGMCTLCICYILLSTYKTVQAVMLMISLSLDCNTRTVYTE